jgi:hypothetical protein
MVWLISLSWTVLFAIGSLVLPIVGPRWKFAHLETLDPPAFTAFTQAAHTDPLPISANRLTLQFSDHPQAAKPKAVSI